MTDHTLNVAQGTVLSRVEAEARRYAEMYPQSSDGRNTFVIFADWVARLAAQPPAAPVETDDALVNELADVAESHFLPTIKAMREALLVAREAILSGGDTIRSITVIDAALAHPGSPARTAPESCPHCINEDDCSSVDVCRAVEEVNSPPRLSAGNGGEK